MVPTEPANPRSERWLLHPGVFCRIVVVFFILSHSLTGCGSRHVTIHSPVYYADVGAVQTTAEQMRVAITRGCAAANWAIVDQKPNRISARGTADGHWAVVEIEYGASFYRIRHLKSSPELAYSGQTIHHRYNYWVRRLDKFLKAECAKQHRSKGENHG